MGSIVRLYDFVFTTKKQKNRFIEFKGEFVVLWGSHLDELPLKVCNELGEKGKVVISKKIGNTGIGSIYAVRLENE